MWCLFHRWVEEARTVVTGDVYMLWKHVGETTVLLIGECCAKCGKRRAYMMQIGLGTQREKINVAVAEYLLRLEPVMAASTAELKKASPARVEVLTSDLPVDPKEPSSR